MLVRQWTVLVQLAVHFPSWDAWTTTLKVSLHLSTKLNFTVLILEPEQMAPQIIADFTSLDIHHADP